MTPETLYERLQAIPGFHPKELAWDFERENQIGEETGKPNRRGDG